MGWQISRRDGQEGKQRVRDQPMAVAVWRGKLRLGRLSMDETEERRIAVGKDGAKRAVATLA